MVQSERRQAKLAKVASGGKIPAKPKFYQYGLKSERQREREMCEK